MLINNTLYTVLTILAPILFMIGLTVLVKKLLNNYYGVFFGLILSGFIFGAFQASAGKVYIIFPNQEYKAYRSIGSFDFTFPTQASINISVPQGKTVVINNSLDEIVIDKISYNAEGYYKESSQWKHTIENLNAEASNQDANSNSYYLVPQSYEDFEITKNTINFFFDEEIPKRIEEFGVHNKVTKYWLHEADYE